MASLKAMEQSTCLEAAALIEVAERGPRSANYRDRIAHIAVCGTCRTTLRDLRKVESLRPHTRWQLVLPRTLLPAAVAAAVVWMVLASVVGAGKTLPPVVADRTHATAMGPEAQLEKKGNEIVAQLPKKLSHAILAESTEPRPKRVRRIRRSRIASPSIPAPEQIVAQPTPRAEGSAFGEVSASNIENGEVFSANTLEGEVISPPRP